MDKYKVERSLLIKRSQLSNNDYNPNKTTERQQEAIAESLNNYGQLTAVLVRPDPDNDGSYIIIDGEHRSMVLDEELYVDVVHDLSEADAKKLTVIMNETRGRADKIELAQLLASINSELGSFEELQIGLPYDDTELQELIDLADVDWDSFSSDSFTTSDDDENSEDANDDDLQDSNVKMLQLFFTNETHAEIMTYIGLLNPIYETDNPTDCILYALREINQQRDLVADNE